jgi:hypothetical protein
LVDRFGEELVAAIGAQLDELAGRALPGTIVMLARLQGWMSPRPLRA